MHDMSHSIMQQAIYLKHTIGQTWGIGPTSEELRLCFACRSKDPSKLGKVVRNIVTNTPLHNRGVFLEGDNWTTTVTRKLGAQLGGPNESRRCDMDVVTKPVQVVGMPTRNNKAKTVQDNLPPTTEDVELAHQAPHATLVEPFSSSVHVDHPPQPFCLGTLPCTILPIQWDQQVCETVVFDAFWRIQRTCPKSTVQSPFCKL